MFESLMALLVFGAGDCRPPVLEIPVAKADAALPSGMERAGPKAAVDRQRPLQKRFKALRERGRDRRAGRGKGK